MSQREANRASWSQSVSHKEPKRIRTSQREPGRAKERAVLSKREPEGARKSKKASQTDLLPPKLQRRGLVF